MVYWKYIVVPKEIVMCIWRIKNTYKSLWTTTGHDHTNFNVLFDLIIDHEWVKKAASKIVNHPVVAGQLSAPNGEASIPPTAM
jgi:hypothetical protein